MVAGGTTAWLLAQRSRDSALVAEAQLSDPTSRPAEAIKLNLSIGGIMETVDRHSTILRFDEGLFDKRAALTPAAERLLTGLGRALEPYSGRISVLVLGYCDDRPLSRTTRYEDNWALARADAVARYLTVNATLPASVFTLQAGVGSPFPNHAPANAARNRTAEIRVSRLAP